MEQTKLPIMQVVNTDGALIDIPGFAIAPTGDWVTKEELQTSIIQTEKKVIDKLGIDFNQKASVVQGKLIENYPLKVKTHIAPWQEGTGEPSPENVRPIHGWNELKLEHCGKNLYDNESARKAETWQQGVYSYIPFKVGKGNKVTFSYSKKLNLGLGIFVLIGRTGGANSKAYGWLYHNTSSSLCNNQLTIIAEDDYIYLNSASMHLEDKRNVFCDNIGDSLQIEISSDKTYYEPYHGESFVQQLPEEVFGGVYDWESGELRSTMLRSNIVKWTKELTKQPNVYRFSALIPNAIRCDIQSGKAYCNIFRLLDIGETYQANKIGFTISANENTSTMYCIPTLSEGATEDYMNGLGISVVYETDKPKTIQLQPHLPPSAFAGMNVLHSNAGDTEVTAKSDTSAIIDSLEERLAVLENKAVNI